MHVLSVAHGFRKSHQLNNMEKYLHREGSMENHTYIIKRIRTTTHRIVREVYMNLSKGGCVRRRQRPIQACLYSGSAQNLSLRSRPHSSIILHLTPTPRNASDSRCVIRKSNISTLFSCYRSLFFFLMMKFQSVLLPKESTLLWNTIYQHCSIWFFSFLSLMLSIPCPTNIDPL